MELLGLYIAATVFGGLVTIVDVFNLFDIFQDSDSDGDNDSDTGTEAEMDAMDSESDVDDASEDADSDDNNDSNRAVSLASHDKTISSIVHNSLNSLRSLVYFSLGFGPTGWFATATNHSVLESLLWAGGAGLVISIGVKSLRRFMQKDLNSQITEKSLHMQIGTVLVGMKGDRLGKVKIIIDGQAVERYAKVYDPDAVLETGCRILVAEVCDDHIKVIEEKV